jgi:hypothetical protein
MIWSYRTGGFLFSSPAVANGILYIGSYNGNIYALDTPTNSLTHISQPTPAPSPTPSPLLATTPTPSPTPQPTVNPTPTPTTSQAPALIIETQPTTIPNLSVESSRNEPGNLLILGITITVAAIALTSLYVTYKKSD